MEHKTRKKKLNKTNFHTKPNMLLREIFAFLIIATGTAFSPQSVHLHKKPTIGSHHAFKFSAASTPISLADSDDEDFSHAIAAAYKITSAEKPENEKMVSFDKVLAMAKAEFAETKDTEPIMTATAVGSSDCIIAIGVVIVDVVGVFFGLAGMRSSVEERAARALLRELGQDTIRGLEASVHILASDASLLTKAKTMWSIMTEIYNAVGIKGIAKAISKSMKWYDYTITGTVVVAQLSLWFATDGAAAIAELALMGAAIAQTTADAVKATKACE